MNEHDNLPIHRLTTYFAEMDEEERRRLRDEGVDVPVTGSSELMREVMQGLRRKAGYLFAAVGGVLLAAYVLAPAAHQKESEHMHQRMRELERENERLRRQLDAERRGPLKPLADPRFDREPRFTVPQWQNVPPAETDKEEKR